MTMTRIVNRFSPLALFLLSFSSAQAESFEVTVKVQSQTSSPEEVLGAASASIISALEQQASKTAEQNHLLNTLTLIQSATVGEEQYAYTIISPKSASAETSSITSQTPGFSLQGIGMQLSVFRRNTQDNGFRMGSRRERKRHPGNGMLMLNDDPITGSQAAGGIFDNKLSSFFNADYSSLTKENSTWAAGFNSSSQRLTAGVDYRHTLNLVTGGVLTFNRSTGELYQNTGALDGQSISGNAFVNYFKDNYSVEAFMNAGYLGFNLQRNISFSVGGTPVYEVAKSDPDGSQLGGGVRGNYDYILRDGTSFTGSLGLNGNRTNIAAFSETGGNGLALKVDKQEITTLSSEISLLVSRAISTNWSVLVPQISVAWLHEYLVDGSTITGRFIYDPSGTPFGFETEQRDADYIVATAGSSALFPGGLVAYAQLTQLYMQANYSRYTFSAGVRKEF